MSDLVLLGYSGVHGAAKIKSYFFPGASARELAFSQGGDSAAAVVVGGRIVAAAAEERFTGHKHTGEFPRNAIAWCLRNAGAAVDDVHKIAHAFDFSGLGQWAERDHYYQRLYTDALSPDAQIKLVAEHFGSSLAQRFCPVRHHDCHAAYAYHSSGFSSAAVLVSDGLGEAESASFFRAVDGKLERMGNVAAMHSLGVLYGLVTHYLGFWFGSDEYKVMGLAPYGDPARFRSLFRNYIRLFPSGNYSVPLLAANTTVEEKQFYETSISILEHDFGPCRAPDELIGQQHVDIAAALQECFNETLLHVLKRVRTLTGESKICLSGGCAMNCSANGVAARSGIFQEMYVSPAAGDDGAAAGAALMIGASLNHITPRRMAPPLLGHTLEDCEIEAALPPSGVRITKYQEDDDQLGDISALLANGNIVAWAQGAMEFGQRALGARSILADPLHVEMRDRINVLVKKREQFRPFAPAVTAEDASRFFEIESGSEIMYDSMLFTTYVSAQMRSKLPAVTHVDGSARVQTVTERANPLFWKLLHTFGSLTGIPILLNTSFNVAGQPIVRTATEAVSTFLGTELNAICIGKYLLVKERPS